MDILVGFGIELNAFPGIDYLVARIVRFQKGLYNSLGVRRFGTVESVGQNEGRREASSGVLAHGNVVLLLIEFGDLPHHWFLLGQVEGERRAHEEIITV